MRELLFLLLLAALTDLFQANSDSLPVIAVVVPGHQGQAVVQALQQSRDFSCRIVLPLKSTKDFSQSGCNVVHADLTSVDSLEQALRGVHGVFATLVGTVTEAGEGGLQMSKNIVDAAAKIDAFLVWSSQKSMRDIVTSKKDTQVVWINSTWIVPWMDAKAAIADYSLEKHPKKTIIFVPADSYSSIWESGYLHIPDLEKPKSYQLSYPLSSTIAIPFVANEDAAQAVLRLFKNPATHVGKTIYFAGDRITTRDLASAFVKLQLGLPVKHVPVDLATFASAFTNAEGMTNLYRLYNDYPLETLGSFDTKTSREILPSTKNLNSYLAIAENKSKILEYFKKILYASKLQLLEQEKLKKQQEATGKGSEKKDL